MAKRRARAKQRAKRDGWQHDPRIQPTEVHKPANDDLTTKANSQDGRGSARRGQRYDQFRAEGWPHMLDSGAMTVMDVADQFGCRESDISRWMAAYREDAVQERARANWTRDEDVEEALLAYEPFTRRFHPEMLIPEYHLEWESEIDGVVGTGGRLCLLGPQRHGKTEFLIRYCQRRIAADPDICILWVSRAKELAEESVGMLRQLLEDESFCEAVLGPGESFQPAARSGKSWTDEKFTVAQRTKVRKSPTVRALGIGGTTSGRDADLIIVDDPQEREDCDSPTTRDKQARWFFTTLLARKMEQTGIALITSRRHMEDIPGKVLRQHGDDWRVITYQAHDPVCTIPDADEDAHTGCVLWPDMRSFAFLMGQKRADPQFFECNYQNNPNDDGTVLITAEDIDRCKDHTRRAGDIPDGVFRLVAGIDPADAKPVAAVLWGWEPDWGEKGRRHVIDIMEAEPGIRGGREILKTWRDRYGCTLFVVEKNMAQSWWQDTEVRDLCSNGKVDLREHYTDRYNKWSTTTGVVAMFARMREEPPSITLPWGDDATRQKMDRLARTFMLFDPNYAGHKHADDDLPMAAWFPQPSMDSWMVSRSAVAETQYPQTAYPWKTGYPTRQGSGRRLEVVA